MVWIEIEHDCDHLWGNCQLEKFDSNEGDIRLGIKYIKAIKFNWREKWKNNQILAINNGKE